MGAFEAPGVSAGVRWEGLQSHTERRTISPVDNRSSVVSPTVLATWKIPDSDTDEVRFGIARTYKAPTARELIPRRWVVAQNSATSPNFQGNPNLQPELSWGLDIAYERNLPRDGFLGINGYLRQIEDVILVQTSTVNGLWIKTPINSGRASVLGIEMEAKGRLRQLLSGAPDLEMRFSLTRNWSHVQSVPGPGNRLERQSPLLINLGVDWSPGQIPVAMGGNYNQEFGGAWRNSDTMSGRSYSIRKLDLYALWTIVARTKLRLSATNVFGLRERYDSRYANGTLAENQSAASEGPPLLSLQLEAAF
ncbi:MAG TPA: TonB-dependent receptor [Ideonella sp.]|nr:TonB-dependent receptor [Ideonella sp.]